MGIVMLIGSSSEQFAWWAADSPFDAAIPMPENFPSSAD
jgi:hypothetical protein